MVIDRRQNPYTQAAITRAIKAALKAGLKVTGVRPDGTVLTDTADNDQGHARVGLTPAPKLRDARERLL